MNNSGSIADYEQREDGRISIFISHSTRRVFSARVRDRLSEKLKDAGFDVLLDKEGIYAGDPWHPILMRWLHVCRGAVILFSHEALNSRWVATEVIVLTWRWALDPQFILVPALLGDVNHGDERFEQFEPVRLRDIQVARVSTREETDTAMEELVDLLISRIRSMGDARPTADARLADLVEQLVTCLRPIESERFLCAAARVLGIDVHHDLHAGDRIQDARSLIAHKLLHTIPEVALDALGELFKGLRDRDYRRDLVDLVKPMWVSPEAARHLIPVARRTNPAETNLAINAEQDTTASYYVTRAYCGWNRVHVVRAAGAGGSAEEVAARYDRAFIIECRLEATRGTDEQKIRIGLERINQPEIHSKETWFFAFDCDAIALGVPEKIRDRYPGVTFLLLTGSDWELIRSSRLRGLLRIEPALEPGAEDAAYGTIGAMEGLCMA